MTSNPGPPVQSEAYRLMHQCNHRPVYLHCKYYYLNDKFTNLDCHCPKRDPEGRCNCQTPQTGTPYHIASLGGY